MLTRRRLTLLTGCAIAIAAWLGPLPSMAVHSFAAHMLLHMTVVTVVAPIVALAIRGTALDPAVRVPRAFQAIPASLGEFVVVWAWHTPELHDAARHHASVFALEQVSFLIAGLWLWIAIVGGEPSAQSRRSASGVIALVLTFSHMTLLGALLSLTPRALYVTHHGAHALADQQLGGTIMLAVSAVAYIGGGLWAGRNLLRQAPATGARS